jgi:anaerobic ribonucleoside-triphosphate reductase
MKGKTMTKKEKIYYSDLTTLVEVCYSCSSQNISITNDGQKSFCKDCNSEDIGAEFPEDLI